MTDPTVLTMGEPGQGLIITPAKKLMIEALRTTFNGSYPNTRLAGMNIDMEYPYLETQYPGIWVKFSLTKLQASGLEPRTFTPTEIYSIWHFEGVFSLTMLALTSKERDLMADGFVEAFAFASVMPTANLFYTALTSSDLVNMTLRSDSLNPSGQSENVGVPWDQNRMAYEDGYSFEVVGQVRSRVQAGVVYTNLAQIQSAGTLTNAAGAPNNAIGNDGNGVWQ